MEMATRSGIIRRCNEDLIFLFIFYEKMNTQQFTSENLSRSQKFDCALNQNDNKQR